MSIKPVKFSSSRAATHREAADLIHGHLTVDGNHVTETENNSAFSAFAESQGVDQKTVKAVDGVRNKFVLGATLAFAEIATGIMKKDSKVESVECSVGLGQRHKLNDTIARDRVFRTPGFAGQAPGKVQKHLVQSVTLGSDADRGLKGLRTELSEEAKKFLKG